MIKVYGWAASICFMLSGAPSAYEAFITKVCNISTGTLILWTIGELCAILYVAPRKDIPLLVNYFINLIFLTIMWRYKELI